MKIPTVGGLLFRTDVQTDVTKATVPYCNFMKAPRISLTLKSYVG